MKRASLKVEPREIGQRSKNRQLRVRGMVPANVYGPGAKNSYCSFDERDLRKIFKGTYNSNTLLELESEDSSFKNKKVVLKTIESDPLTWRPVHVDLYEVSESRPLDVQIPIILKGTPKGVKLSGGILQVVRRSVLLRGLINDLPESIEVDISELDIEDSIHLSDINIPENVKPLDSLKYTVASVTEPEKEVAPTPAEVEPAEGEGAASATASAAASGEAAEDDAKKEPKK